MTELRSRDSSSVLFNVFHMPKRVAIIELVRMHISLYLISFHFFFQCISGVNVPKKNRMRLFSDCQKGHQSISAILILKCVCAFLCFPICVFFIPSRGLCFSQCLGVSVTQSVLYMFAYFWAIRLFHRVAFLFTSHIELSFSGHFGTQQLTWYSHAWNEIALFQAICHSYNHSAGDALQMGNGELVPNKKEIQQNKAMKKGFMRCESESKISNWPAASKNNDKSFELVLVVALIVCITDSFQCIVIWTAWKRNLPLNSRNCQALSVLTTILFHWEVVSLDKYGTFIILNRT